ncbi:hypothetical protein GCM10010911_52370 [Paenibacillus nasutitermitis]|uniref:ABC-2 type transporter domain-containing protein n=2 Tax=Paenibacillus nasutitermitis TaxID=1652958 RepID=A0A916ZDB8_9BACL|nr:hypothetical protein GCM10010911_52370 [Paenibacillus nasutitermitis]
MVWFYLTPIIYNAAMIPEPYHRYIMLNPLTLIVEMFRSIVLDGVVPSGDLFWGALLYSLCFLLLGYFIFNKRESRLAEEL